MADYYEEIFLSHRMKDPFAEMVYHKCEVLPASVFFHLVPGILPQIHCGVAASRRTELCPGHYTDDH